MDNISLLKKAAEKSGLKRIRYQDKNVKTSLKEIVVLTFFGDIRSLSIVSAFLLKRFKEESKGSKYFILASYPGYENLFPYVDEYWSIADLEQARKIMDAAIGFENRSNLAVAIQRELNLFFEDVLDYRVLEAFYHNGFLVNFFERYGKIKKFLPNVPSVGVLGDFAKELAKNLNTKIFIYPSSCINMWDYGKIQTIKVPKEFWVSLFERLKLAGFSPIIYQSFATQSFPELWDKYTFFSELDMLKVLGVMRYCDCVLDVFSGISRLAFLARSPFLCVDERRRSEFLHEFEIDELLGTGIPREYCYAFGNLLEKTNSEAWKVNLFDLLVNKLDFVQDISRDDLPSVSEVEAEVSFDGVRQRKLKKYGTRLIKITRD